MNAAFLMVATAWFAGDTAAATPAPAADACSSCATCDSCGHSRPKLFDKLHGHKSGCCDTCPAPKCHAPKCAPACAPAPKCAPVCAPAPKCSTCDTCGGGPKLLDRLKAKFHHDKGCCDSCSTCGTVSGGTTVMPKAGETIPTPPKKMPNPGTKEVLFDTPPAGAPNTPAIENVPNAGRVPPAVVPNVDSENLRNPF